MKKNRFLALWIILAATLLAQDAHKTLTNVDVLNLANSGVGDKTIILAIQQATSKFDMSPQAVIELKKGGVSDDVLNAMLAVARNTTVASSPDVVDRECSQLLAKALNAIGTSETLASVHATRLKGTTIQPAGSGIVSLEFERIVVYADKFYMASHGSNGLENSVLVTPEYNYQLSQRTSSPVPAPVLEDIQLGIKSEPAFIAQHLSQYSCTSEGTEQIGEVATANLRIRVQGGEFQWNIDPATGRLLRSRTTKKASGTETVVDYSDWRFANGMYIAFKRHIVENGHAADSTIASYEVNPAIDATLFAPPAHAAKENVEKPCEKREAPKDVAEVLRKVWATDGDNSVKKDVCPTTKTSVLVEVVDAQNLTQSQDTRGDTSGGAVGTVVNSLTGRRTHTDASTIYVIVNGEHALLDCYERRTGCATIGPGKYTGELDGDSIWVNYEMPITHKPLRNHYKIAGSW
jgi:hypothetical protein